MATIAERLQNHLENTSIQDLLVTSVTEANGASRTMLGLENVIKAQKLAETQEDQTAFYGSIRVH
jgi:hypothetical protein